MPRLFPSLAALSLVALSLAPVGAEPAPDAAVPAPPAAAAPAAPTAPATPAAAPAGDAFGSIVEIGGAMKYYLGEFNKDGDAFVLTTKDGDKTKAYTIVQGPSSPGDLGAIVVANDHLGGGRIGFMGEVAEKDGKSTITWTAYIRESDLKNMVEAMKGKLPVTTK